MLTVTCLYVCVDSQALRELSASPELFVLDNVQCSGNEDSLLDCSRNPLGVHNCDQSSGAGVQCQGTVIGMLLLVLCESSIPISIVW